MAGVVAECVFKIVICIASLFLKFPVFCEINDDDGNHLLMVSNGFAMSTHFKFN